MDRTRPLRTAGRVWGPERVKLGLTIRELEKLSGVDKAYISMAESGRMVPTAEEYQAIMEAFRKVREQAVTA